MEHHKRAQLRKGVAQDAVAIAAIFDESRAEMVYVPRLHTRDETLSYFVACLEEHECVVVATEEEVVGFVLFERHFVHHLCVSSAFRRQGLGSALLEWVKAQSKGKLELWTFQKNLTGRRFFEQRGLVCVEETDGSGNEERVPDARYRWTGK